MDKTPFERITDLIEAATSSETLRSLLLASPELLEKIRSHEKTVIDPSVARHELNTNYRSLLKQAFIHCWQPGAAIVLLELGDDPVDFLVQAIRYVYSSDDCVKEIKNFALAIKQTINEESRQKLRDSVNKYPQLPAIEKLKKVPAHNEASDGKPRKLLPTLTTTITPLIQACRTMEGKAALAMAKLLIDELGADPNIVIDVDEAKYHFDHEVEDESEAEEAEGNDEGDEKGEKAEAGDEGDDEEEQQGGDTRHKQRQVFSGFATRTYSALGESIINGNVQVVEYLLSHPKFSASSLHPVEVHKLFSRLTGSTSDLQLQLLEHFPYWSSLPYSSSLAKWFFGTPPSPNEIEQQDPQPNGNDKEREHNDESGDDDNEKEDEDDEEEEEDDDESGSDIHHRSYQLVAPKLDVSNISQEDFEKYHKRVFGTSNPERRGKSDVVVQAMFRCMSGAYKLRTHFNEQHYDETLTKVRGPIYCYDRFGVSIVCLGGDDEDDAGDENDQKHKRQAKGLGEEENINNVKKPLPTFLRKKYLLIGGEHEDSYDPDFQIYNDVYVVDPKNQTYEMFAYPKEVFPPTDFHTATLVTHLGAVFIIGNVGYMLERVPDYTPVYRLDLTTMRIAKVETEDEDRDENDEGSPRIGRQTRKCGPGWISEHVAWYRQSENEIAVSGGKLAKEVKVSAASIQQEIRRREQVKADKKKSAAASVARSQNDEDIDDDDDDEDDEEEYLPLPTTKLSFDNEFMKDKIYYLNLDSLKWRSERYVPQQQ